MNISRRIFLLSILSFSACLGAFGIFSFRNRARLFVAQSGIRQKLSYLDISEEVYHRFFEDLKKLSGSSQNRTLSGWFDPTGDRINALAVQLLMSTNFFNQHQKKQDPIQYIKFYNPYEDGCRNPFARL